MYCENDQILINNLQKIRTGAVIILAFEKGFNYTKPKMNGIEFLIELKKNPLFRSIPVIILTTSKDQEDMLSTFNFGISGYMVKPLDYLKFQEMVDIIKKYWDLSEHPY